MTKKKISTEQSKYIAIAIMLGLATIVLSGLTGYGLAYKKYNPSNVPTDNTPGYITADAARSQVNNFYQQYLHPKKDSPVESRKVYVSSYGSKNLSFYRDYYQHGFDPIVCSSDMPTSVAVTNVRPGAGAVVDAETKYPDGSSASISLNLVINVEGFKIDSITCPGTKGNLPPINQRD